MTEHLTEALTIVGCKREELLGTHGRIRHTYGCTTVNHAGVEMAAQGFLTMKMGEAFDAEFNAQLTAFHRKIALDAFDAATVREVKLDAGAVRCALDNIEREMGNGDCEEMLDAVDAAIHYLREVQTNVEKLTKMAAHDGDTRYTITRR